MSKLQLIGAALLLLGCYHVVLQQFTSSTGTARLLQASNARLRAARSPPCADGAPTTATAATATATATAAATTVTAASTSWRLPPSSNLNPNGPASALLSSVDPASTTLHFTFGSASMMDFLHNWRHFALKVGIAPLIVGAADKGMLQACTAEGIAAMGINEGLDVWTYTRSLNASTTVQDGKAAWKYYRHHKSSFLELGLVKVAFLWELVLLGFDVLISDLDIVWLSPRWEQWMTYRYAAQPPLPEAALLAMSDVLVTTDELDEKFDQHGTWDRWPFGVGWGRRSDLNTGVLFFRATNGSRAFLQAWRKAMLAKREVEHTNDQFVFCDMVRQAGVEPVTTAAERLEAWRASLRSHGLLRDEEVLRSIAPTTRVPALSKADFPAAAPCLPDVGCAPHRFTIGTLPLRAFTSGHTYFMQRVQNFEGHALPRNELLTLHFTFQYSDTPDFPHGKRQRAREAALWTSDPPSYYEEGRFVRLAGPLFTAKQRVAIERKFPEWSAQRHMHIDALQRAAVRDLLALSLALNATLIMPPLVCTCDRYWGFLQNCRMPTGPENMPLPFRCSQDALFEIKRWNDLGVRFREENFLDHPHVPPAIRSAAVRVVVHKDAPRPPPQSAEARFTTVLRPGTPMSDVGAAVAAANPAARLIEVGTPDIKLLCKWLGSRDANRRFNRLARYVLTESARYCPEEDHNTDVANVPNWNWRNPFTAYNCTWGFHHPTDFPEDTDRAPCRSGGSGVALVERSNSTTCPRAMLCDWNTLMNGETNGKRISRCNLEGYGGLDYDVYGERVKAKLASMPEGRCPTPPGDRPGQGLGWSKYE